MALINCDFFSESLGMSTSMTVILPQQTNAQIGMTGVAGANKFPVLYLLHGDSDDHTIWLRRTSIERYVAPLGLAVVMPAVHKSYYTDMVYGQAYWTFVSEELPAIVKSFFPISDKREDTFVAGLSMGGYGAGKIALSNPDRYAAVACLSGAVGLADRLAGMADGIEGPYFEGPNRYMFERIFGDLSTVKGSRNDLAFLATELAESGRERPKIYQCCGTEDFLYEDNLKFRDLLLSLGYELQYEEEPANHTWDYWDLKIQEVLKWLPLKQS